MSMEAFKELLGDIGAELGNRITEAKEMLGDMRAEMGAELGRLGVQGQAEMANALFNGSAFLPYGEGQRSPEVQQAQDAPGVAPATPEVQQEQERGGRE